LTLYSLNATPRDTPKAIEKAVPTFKWDLKIALKTRLQIKNNIK
jgi:hypothetical protein